MYFMHVFLAGCTALAATTLGAAGVFVIRKIPPALYATVVSFCAGMMGFSALEMLNEAHSLGGHRTALAGLIAGMVAFLVMDKLMPHVHMALRGAEIGEAKKKVAMLVGTITIHNIPEGFALAAAFAGSASLGWLVTLSIALQDIPEGLIVSAPAACYGVETRRSFFWGVLSGLVEFASAIAGFLFLRAMSAATPFALGFSGGAMTYVIFSELLPDAMQAENRYVALGAAIAGFAAAYGFGALIGF
ncbi:MAG: ZIP family metal transporter [Chlamydiota bacterium]